MIIGIGADIIEINRIKTACKNVHFKKKIYSAKELGILVNHSSLAGNFAAKEAVAKSLGMGFSGYSPADIEILRDENGAPVVNLYGGALRLSESLEIGRINVTISHCRDYAIAYAVAERF